MLKRTLLIGLLVLMGMVWIAADPPDDEEYTGEEFRASYGHEFGWENYVACFVAGGPPYGMGGDVNAYGLNECIGHVAQTKLKIEIKRHRYLWVWESEVVWNSGWLNQDYIEETAYTACEPGTHTYKTYVKAWGRDYTNGDVTTTDGHSGNSRFNC